MESNNIANKHFDESTVHSRDLLGKAPSKAARRISRYRNRAARRAVNRRALREAGKDAS